jgi:hypothetical protein
MTAWPLTPAEAALVADPIAVADALCADAATASMAPLDLLPSEQADYAEALEVAADFLTSTFPLALPVAAGLREVGTGTLAAMLKANGTTSDRVAIEAAAARVASWVNTYETHGSQRIYPHRLASIVQSAEPDDVESPRLFLVEVPTGTGLTQNGKLPCALVVLWPSKTYSITDRVTGEVVERVDLGNYNPARVWAGHGGIVRMLTRDQADGIELDWSYEPEVHNLAWALSTLRRLGRIAAARADRRDQLAQEQAEADMPF